MTKLSRPRRGFIGGWPWRPLALLVVATIGVATCSTQTVVLPSRNLDRPTDMAFACLAIRHEGDAVKITGQPMGLCHPPGVLDLEPGIPDVAGTEYRTYAFVTNAGRGDLSAINMSFCRGETGCYPPGAEIVDLDPNAVGYGAAPLGELPEVIAASQDGCRVVTANRGSCDLTLVNPAALLADSIGADSMLGAYARTIVPRTTSGRLAVAPGEIAFVPQQTKGVPGNQYCSAEGTLAAPVGAPVASAPVPWRAVVTFPSCDLIALVELPSGDILDSYRVATETGSSRYSFVHTGRDPVCPVADCGRSAPAATDAGNAALGDRDEGDTAAADAAGTDDAGADLGDDGAAGPDAEGDTMLGDAGSGDAGGTPVVVASNLRVNALAMHPEGKRIYFGAMNARFVGALDITGQGDTLAEPAAEISSVELHAGAAGVTRLRLSVDPFAYSKGHDADDPTRAEYGRFVAGRHDQQPSDPLEFLYAIARDGSVRVVHIGRARPFECDLQIDPHDPKAMAIDGDYSVRPGCFEYLAVDGPRRLRFAGAPGLRFGSAPQDIAFANYRTPRKSEAEGLSAAEMTSSLGLDELMLNGAFAFVMTSAGGVYILNIDPELRRTSQVRRLDPAAVDCKLEPSLNCEAGRFDELPEPLTHSLRDSNVVTYSAALGPQNGPPRVDTPPSGPSDGVHLKSFPTPETRINARVIPQTSTKDYTEQTYVYFPNRTTVRAQDWLIGWEGDLTSVRITGDIKGDLPLDPPLATTIMDNGAGFCGAGVDGDVLTLMGCETDSACAPGDVCTRSPGVPSTADGRSIMGICLPRDKATMRREDPPCRRMLETFRRYEMVTTTDGEVTVVPKRSEVPRPAYKDGEDWVACTTDADCRPDMSNPSLAYKCISVTSRPDGTAVGIPLGPQDLKRRCFNPCGWTDKADGKEKSSPCLPGRSCVRFGQGGSMPDGSQVTDLCAEGAPMAKDCGLEQLFSYKISAGNAFVVSGAAAGRTEGVRKEAGPNGPRCVVDDLIKDRAFVARIPMKTESCAPESTPPFKMGEEVRDWNDVFLAGAFPPDGIPSPNPCFIREKTSDPVPVVSALFQNTEIRFVLTDLQKRISETAEIRFTVHGGVAAQTLLPSIDASAGLPSRLVLGPIPQPKQAETAEQYQMMLSVPTVKDGSGNNLPGWFSDLPYLFIVDQRQFANGRLGVRGQILRITPRFSDTAPLPGFEGFTAGGKYFPIQ